MARSWASAARPGRAQTSSRPETWLERYRREAGISQYELSWATGISVRDLQRLESGAYENPPVRDLITCAVAL